MPFKVIKNMRPSFPVVPPQFRIFGRRFRFSRSQEKVVCFNVRFRIKPVKFIYLSPLFHTFTVCFKIRFSWAYVNRNDFRQGKLFNNIKPIIIPALKFSVRHIAALINDCGKRIAIHEDYQIRNLSKFFQQSHAFRPG